MKRLSGWIGLLLAAMLALSGCGGGGGSSSGTASLRVVNASPDYGLLDFYSDSSVAIGSVATGTASSYASLSSGTHATSFTRAGATAVVETQNRTLAANASYTVLAYGWEGALHTFFLGDDEPAPSTGQAKFRAINAAPDAGALDVYVTGVTDALADATPVISGVASGSLSSYAGITQGTYRIRVTGAGDKTDLRLDIPGVTLSDQEVASLVVTPTSGGVLVNALVLDQKGSITSYATTQARVRLVAAMADNASVAATVGASALSSGMRSPLVGNYLEVAAGLLPLDLKVNGSTLASTNLTVAPGADLTLMVYGTSASPQSVLLADDNRLPASGMSKLRLVHAVSGLDSGLTLVSDYSALVDDIAYGSASAYIPVTSGTQSEIDVTSPLSTAALLAISNPVLKDGGVYTVFMMGGASAPAGVLRKDR